MKLYVLITTLGLAASVAVGYWNGKHSAETRFTDACSHRSVALVYDPRSDRQRVFHCFEMKRVDVESVPPEAPAPAQSQAEPLLRGQLVL
jgi:hypothetical protein